MNLFRRHVIGFALTTSLVSVSAFAAGDEHAAGAEHAVKHDDAGGHGAAHGGHGEPHIANWWTMGEAMAKTPALGWLTITFLIFAGGLVYLVKKPLSLHLQTRADTVEKAMAEAQKAKEAAEKRAREAEARLASLDDEMKKMRVDFEAQGKAEAERIEATAKEMAAKVAKDAEDTIRAEVERAKETLRGEASKLALQVAEERIKTMLSAADDERLKKSLIRDLTV